MTDPGRAAARARLLADTGWDRAACHLLAGDASPRRYDRLTLGARSAVLMDAPPATGEDVRPFAALTGWLGAHGYAAPRILGIDASAGFLLLEDLGDALYARHVAAHPEDETTLYRAAVELLADLARHPAPDRIAASGDLPATTVPPYDRATLCREAGLVAQWWMDRLTPEPSPAPDRSPDLVRAPPPGPLPAPSLAPEHDTRPAPSPGPARDAAPIARAAPARNPSPDPRANLSRNAPPPAPAPASTSAPAPSCERAGALADLIGAATAPAAAESGVLVLRDYHAENLVWLPGRTGHARVGLLDYQDALAGHPAYDLVSLLEDARRDTAPALRAAMLDHYLAIARPSDPAAFRAAYAALGAQRNLKIVGIFARLALRDGKPQYLELIPRVWAHLMGDLAHPALGALRGWVARHVPVPDSAALGTIRAMAAHEARRRAAPLAAPEAAP